MHNMVQQVCFRMATSTSGKTTKSRNVQKTCTSYSDQTRRWETRATWGYTRTRTHLHGDRSGTTSPMGFGGTPTVYQDWSYTDKLHLIMRLQQSPTQYHIVVLWPPAEISVLVTWTKRTKWPDIGYDRHPESSSSHSIFLPLLFHKAPPIPVLVSQTISLIRNTDS